MKVKQLKLSICTLISVIFCLSEYTSGYSQDREVQQPFYNIRTEHGLPSLETYSVKQDSQGYIWICTDAGVCRYDGFEYKNFTTKDGLTDNVVFDTYEDIKGRIWFLTYNSALCYLENNKIHPYKYNNKIKSLLKDKIATQKEIWIDANENLFYELYDVGIIKIAKKGEVTNLSPLNNEVCIHEVEGVNVLSNNMIDRGLLFRNLITLNEKGEKQIIDSIVISSRYSYPKENENINQGYFIFGNKLYDLHKRKVLFQSNGLLSLSIKNSVFYISTTNGLVRGKLENGKFILLPILLAGHSISGIYFDNKNGVWISTLDAGVFYTYILSALNESDYKKNSSFGDISSIGKLNKSIVVGNNSGLILSEDQLVNLDDKFPLNGVVKFASLNDHLFISNSVIKNLKCNVGKYGNVFYNWTANIIGKKEKVYFVHESYVLVYEKKNQIGHLTKLYNGASDYSKNIKARLQTITATDKGEVIVGTKNQLYYVKNKQLIPIDIPGLKNTDISFIQHDAFWGLLVGTRGDGLFVFKDNRLVRFTEKDGLLNDHINTVSVGINGRIYIGMPNGLSIISKENQIGNLNKNYTFEDIDINVIHCDEQAVYLGTKTGLLKLSYRLLDACFAKRNTSKVLLKSIKFDEELVENEKKIIFPSNAVLLQLSFSVIQFDNWLNKKFQYKIGENGQWINIESPTINLYRPSGNFDVFVRYLDVQNNWSEPYLISSVKVVVPFWQRRYFWTAIAFVLLTLVFFYYQRKQGRIFDKLINESNMLSLEQQMQNARMNPHFVFNVLNSIHSYMLNEETEKADVYLMKFSRLMREILGSTKEGVIKLSEEISILNKYLELEQLRFKQSFEFIVQMEGNNTDISIPSMMIQPFVENAVLYSKQMEGAGTTDIIVNFELQSSSILKATISNAGVPSLEAQVKINDVNTKNAIGITRKRLENYNKLFNTSDYGVELLLIEEKVTVFELMIPIIKN